MFNKAMSDWFDGFEGAQPVSDGAWANGWAPLEQVPAAKPAVMTVHDVVAAQVMFSRDVQSTQGMGGAPNHG